MRAIFALLALGVVITLGFMLYAGEPEKAGWWLLFVPFAVWALVPYGAFVAFLRKGLRAPAARGLAIVAAALLVGLAFAALYTTFVVESDAQGGLVFLFLPVWQLVGLAPFGWGVRMLERRSLRDDSA